MSKFLLMGKCLLCLLCVMLLYIIPSTGCAPPAEEYPESSHEFDIQGLTFRSIIYYYNEGIYPSIYNKEDNLRLISKAGNVGANYLCVKAFYDCAGDGSLIGNDEEAKACLGEAIGTTHENGMKVFLSPYVEAREFWPEKRWNLSVDVWTECVLMWAQFAEENGVEVFAPGFEMGLILDREAAAAWFPSILPQIREVYGGLVTFVEVPWGEQWDYLDAADALTGYDGAGITVFPWVDYGGVSDIRNFEEVRSFAEDRADRLDAIAEKYDCDCRFVAYLGLDLWYGEMPAPDIRAQGYSIMLDVFREHDIDGVFLHLWASEHDHLGDSRDVENMLKGRWTVSE